jgi:hypothetical protein
VLREVLAVSDSDWKLANALLDGYVEDEKGRLHHRFFKRGSEDEKVARQAIGQIFRGPKTLDRQLRNQLADLFDPPISAERELRFAFRKKHTDHVHNTQIAEHIWKYAHAGDSVEVGIQSAMDKFEINHDMTMRIWGRYRPLLESAYGPLPRRARKSKTPVKSRPHR